MDRTIRLISVALLIFFKQDRTGSGKKKIQLMKVDCIVLSWIGYQTFRGLFSLRTLIGIYIYIYVGVHHFFFFANLYFSICFRRHWIWSFSLNLNHTHNTMETQDRLLKSFPFGLKHAVHLHRRCVYVFQYG